jgi:hypothetical protein
MMRLKLLGLLLFTGLVGCASTSSSEPPSWSTGTAEQYPGRLFITAIGEGLSREQAEQRAFSALARVFEVNIQEESTDLSLFRQQTGESSESINRQTSSRQLITATEQILEGATPVEYWNEPQRHLVLVALERRGAEQRLRQKMVQLDQQTLGLRQYADNASLNPVIQLSALEQARQLQLSRAPLNRNLSVVSGKALTPPVSVAMLEQQIRDRLAQLRFRLSAESELLALLEHAVAQIGAQSQADAGLQLIGLIDREPITQRQGWYWLRGAFQLSLSNQEGVVIAQQRWPIKVSAQQPGMIEQRLRDQTNAQIAGQLYQLVSSVQLNQ